MPRRPLLCSHEAASNDDAKYGVFELAEVRGSREQAAPARGANRVVSQRPARRSVKGL
jgi:hypothetical protein